VGTVERDDHDDEGKTMRESKEIRALLREAEEHGARVEVRSKHYTVFPPNRSDSPFTVPHGPRGSRSIRNLRARLRRLGLTSEGS